MAQAAGAAAASPAAEGAGGAAAADGERPVSPPIAGTGVSAALALKRAGSSPTVATGAPAAAAASRPASPPDAERYPAVSAQCHAERQLLALLAQMRNRRRWWARLSGWVWGHSAAGDGSFPLFLWLQVLANIEQKEEHSIASEDDDDRDITPTEVDPASPRHKEGSVRRVGSGQDVTDAAEGSTAACIRPLGRDVLLDVVDLLWGRPRRCLTSNALGLAAPAVARPPPPPAEDGTPPAPRFCVNTEVALRLVRQTTDALTEMPNVVEADVPAGGKLVIVGDIHGQLADLRLILDEEQEPGPLHHYLFNGDWVDRGPDGLEVVLLLYALRLAYPGCVWLNRGNHEDRNVSARYGFSDELRRKEQPRELWDALQDSFEALPLVHVITHGERRKYVVVHGGLPDGEVTTLEEIAAIDRRRPVPSSRNVRRPRPHTELPVGREDRVFQALMWSDPSSNLPPGDRYKMSERGAGILFASMITQEFLERNRVDQGLIRSHDVVRQGYQLDHQGDPTPLRPSGVMCETVFSASSYHGAGSNKGAYLVVTYGPDQGRVPESALSVTVRSFTAQQDGSQLLNLSARTGQQQVPSHLHLASVESRVMSRLGNLVFRRRSQLLCEFQSRDKQQKGCINKRDWVDVMRLVIGSDLPWWNLAPHLARNEGFGRIAYVHFIERFQNRLAQKWMASWASEMLQYIGPRLHSCARGIAEQLHGDKDAQLSYHEVCEALRRTISGLSATGAYYLFTSELDKDHSGFVDAAEWAQLPRHNAPGVLDLWDLRSKGHDHKSRYGGLMAALDGGGITPEDFPRRAMVAMGQNYGDEETRAMWQQTAESLAMRDESGKVTRQEVERAVERLGENSHRAETVMQIIESAARAQVELSTLFYLMDADGNNFLDFNEFCDGMRRLRITQSDHVPEDWERTLWDEIDANKDGKVTIDEFIDALSIVDSWPPSWRQRRRSVAQRKAHSDALRILPLQPSPEPIAIPGQELCVAPLAAAPSSDSLVDG